MAEEESFQEKTEEPTQKRLEDARQEGNVPRSIELGSGMIVLTSVLGLFFFGSRMWGQMTDAGRFIFANAVNMEVGPHNLHQYAEICAVFLMRVVAPICVLLMVVGILTGLGQNEPNFTLKPLQPKLNKMDPIKGIKRIFFSAKALVEMVKSILKVAAVASLAIWTIKGIFADYILLLDQEVGQFFIYLMSQIWKLSIRIALLFLLIAILDLLWQRHQHTKKLRMSMQEIKDERKQQEGDPQIKSRIRSIQMEVARKRMMAQVQEADVVVTNPTSLAVALKYDSGDMTAPVVLAKGARKIAEKIKEIAKKHNIPIVENKPLAQILYKTVEVGTEVPADLYKAVAEVLAYVYRLKNKTVPV
ncbi:MAG: flagellar biosynthesis protein FlhB [Gemmatimonadota bacterium]|nr:flagellar biosynthesis protein FlhB [Gemmatimonadota bacterium]